MSKTIKKNIFTGDALNILSWIESEDSMWAKGKLPIRIQWDMKKNVSELQKIRDTYNEFYQKIMDKYSDDKYSQDVVGDDGMVNRNVRPEYIADYQNEINEIVTIENEVNLKQFAIEDFGDIDILIHDASLLDFFIYEEEEPDEECERCEGIVE